ncbi:dynamin family protein [Exiguobacterium sp. MER 193]|uniref:dynamin family protein n=1 Tax=Exiguobacterium sp. MER 193 TaxID=2939564 RepID=UPI002041B07F|nr:dynamin family protein [Exiguobacterium sp. MER 193]
MNYVAMKNPLSNIGLKKEHVKIDFLNAYEKSLHTPTVAFVGEFSSGKTSLIEALLGQKVGHVSALEATKVPVYIVYGRAKAVYTVSKHQVEHVQRFALDQVAEISASSEQAEWLLVTLPIQQLKSISLIDTPGTNAEASYALDFRDAVTYAWCSPYGEVFSETQLNTLREIGITSSHWFATKVDLVDEDEEEEIEELYEEMLQDVPFRGSSRYSSVELHESEEEREKLWIELLGLATQPVDCGPRQTYETIVKTRVRQNVAKVARSFAHEVDQVTQDFQMELLQWQNTSKRLGREVKHLESPADWSNRFFRYVRSDENLDKITDKLMNVIKTKRVLVTHEKSFILETDDVRLLEEQLALLETWLENYEHPAVIELVASDRKILKEVEEIQSLKKLIVSILKQHDTSREVSTDWSLTVHQEVKQYVDLIQTHVMRDQWLHRISSLGTFERHAEDATYFDTLVEAEEQEARAKYVQQLTQSENEISQINRETLYKIEDHFLTEEERDDYVYQPKKDTRPWQAARQLLKRLKHEKKDVLKEWNEVDKKRRQATKELSHLIESMKTAKEELSAADVPAELTGVNRTITNTLEAMKRAVVQKNDETLYRPVIELPKTLPSPSSVQTAFSFAIRKWAYPRFFGDWLARTLLLFILIDGMAKFDIMALPVLDYSGYMLIHNWPFVLLFSAAVAWIWIYRSHRLYERYLIWLDYRGKAYRDELKVTDSLGKGARIGLTIMGIMAGFGYEMWHFYHPILIVTALVTVLIHLLARTYSK